MPPKKGVLTLRRYIEDGWDKDAGGQKKSSVNIRIAETIDILIDVCARLIEYHKQGKWFAGRLTPDLVRLAGGDRKLRPSLPDPETLSGSADSDPAVSSFRMPGLSTASPGETDADTYSVGAMLYFALTGDDTSNLMEKFQDKNAANKVREDLQTLFPVSGFADFAQTAFEFFQTAFHTERSMRFVTDADSLSPHLATALLKIRRYYGKRKAAYARFITDDETTAYQILDSCPLYRFADGPDGHEIHLLCFGSGEFIRTFIAISAAVGQTTAEYKLFIHVISRSAEEYRGRLLHNAPLLRSYAVFDDDDAFDGSLPNDMKVDHPYVYFTFDTIDLTADADLETAAAKYAKARYIVVSLGSEETSTMLAERLRLVYEKTETKGQLRVIHYYGDRALNSSLDTIRLFPFSDATNMDFTKKIVDRAFRVHTIYTALGSKESVSREKLKNDFLRDEYLIRGSVSSAVAARYRLFSAGIDYWEETVDLVPAQDGPSVTVARSPEEAAELYRTAIDPKTEGTKRFIVLESEHRRYLLYMAAEGYREPTFAEMEAYSFRYNENGFNSSFKDTRRKLHFCLVPCDDCGIRLEAKENDFWTAEDFGGIRKDLVERLDPLERMSLYAYYICKKRISDPRKKRRIDLILSELSELLSYRKEDGSEEYMAAMAALDKLREWLTSADLLNLDLSKEKLFLDSVETTFDEAGVDAGLTRRQIRQDLQAELSVIKEYRKRKNYKMTDVDIIDSVPYICFGDHSFAVVCLPNSGSGVLADIEVGLMMEPERIVYLDKKDDEALAPIGRFFEGRGNNTSVESYVPEGPSGMTQEEKLLSLLRGLGPRIVIDATAASPVDVCTALNVMERLKQGDASVTLVCLDNNGALVKLHGAEMPVCFPIRKKTIRPEEIFALYGALPKTGGDYMLRLELKGCIERLFNIYKSHKEAWKQFDFIKNSLKSVKYSYVVEEPGFTSLSSSMTKERLENSGLRDALKTLETNCPGFFTVNWQPGKGKAFTMTCPDAAKGDTGLSLQQSFDSLFDQVASAGDSQDVPVPRYDCTASYTGKRLTVCLETTSVKYKPNKDNPAFDQLLEDLNAEGFIRNFSHGSEIRYEYADAGIRDALRKSGNILEIYIWHAARESGLFDEVESNLKFLWSDRDVDVPSNELDVVMTRGITTYIVSCKTGTPNTSDLYEIKTIAMKYDARTVPVLVEASDIEANGIFRSRAEQLGIRLILSSDLETPERLKNALAVIVGDKS